MAGASASGFGGKRTKLKTTTTQDFPEDRISALPDSLLLHILSFLGTKEVVRTCLLSKSWQFLWTDMTEIDLYEISSNYGKIRRFVDWVGRMLAMCGGLHLNKFAVSFCYDKRFVSNVNFWVRFAVKNKVKNIALTCLSYKKVYVLPQILYSHSSLTSLVVGYYVMAPQGAIEWGSLKSLSIDSVELSNCVMETILSGCPVLEVLQLKACRGSNCLNICSPKLTTLEIECWVFGSDGESFLEISAPHILDLTISWIFVDFHFRIKNLSSVVRASFCSFVQDDWETYGTPDVTNSIIQLLESLKSLEELELRPCCIEIFSVLEMKGLKLPPSKVSCLTLTPSNNTESIAGILGFLKSSPNLKTLVIRGRKLYHDEAYVTQDQAAAYLQNGNLDLDLFHLKTIKIIGFKVFLSGPMHMLVQVLLKSAKVLEKIVISAEEEPFEISSTNTTSIDLANFALKLGALPKVSTEAVVLVC